MAEGPDRGYGVAVLLDNSAWARVGLGQLDRRDRVRFEHAVRGDQVLVCPPFELEALYSARDWAGYQALLGELRGFRPASADGRTWERAAKAQRELAQDRAVSHRVKPIDLLIAAIADRHGLGVLHYDHDYDVIRENSSLAYCSVWVAARGTID